MVQRSKVSTKFEFTITYASDIDKLSDRLKEHMNEIVEEIKHKKFVAVHIKTEVRQASFREMEIESDVEGI